MSKTPLFIKIARPTYGAYLLRRNHIETIGMDILAQIQGPFLVLGNHTHTLDSFFISAASPVHIRWVAGAYLFKLRGVKTMLGSWIGGISKQQGRSDLFTIKAISAALKKGEVVGLFPEGTRTWDGEPVGFDNATAKLVRMFKVPVVIINLEGGYLLKPRWADKTRKGKAILRVLPPLMPETIKSMTLAQLKTYLESNIGFSHQAWQKQHHTPFRSKTKAKGLERVLYLCPDCGCRSCLTTSGNSVVCSHCDMTVKFDEYDHFTLVKGKNPFKDLPSWHTWEKEQLRNLLQNEKKEDLLFPPDQGVLLQKGKGNRLIRLSKHFELTLSREGMVAHTLETKQEKTLSFPFDQVQSMIINAKSTIELYLDGELYRIRIQKDSSILKYIECYKTIKELTKALPLEVST
ncbi:lysophospholipid acyltransferase family protein [uncultured Sphaerochaeta sp.]|uniref:lysophospholipid acyltransferase family protein n=1 Tax=uncultured Sphaerochaeta sp. TaxID=886478 RepID=UPI002A0A7DAA|nr:lysophospholipid acyltransferase family protein [uncultured Sphaerochaeta sp.]